MSSSVEILGQWITLPDPDSVASLSNHYYGVCTTLADTKSQLSSIGSPQAAARWTGLAADAFAARLGALPGELEQAWQSYNAVARALSGYSSNLRPVVAALRSLASQAEEAQGTLNATQATRDQVVRTGQESATGVWNTKLAEAQAAVSALARRRSSLLTERLVLITPRPSTLTGAIAPASVRLPLTVSGAEAASALRAVLAETSQAVLVIDDAELIVGTRSRHCHRRLRSDRPAARLDHRTARGLGPGPGCD